ncbi:2415_t:CDS:2 [Paraglomus brasilianum]|uniref:2415_t:CDS:1 n=1 Tax=Paraglomus brasilianum TaxID=144538 RepID=A0A9N9DGK8_9GLOM|nr:2415_t:CDS:2 [Paraglomus brasilianum]
MGVAQNTLFKIDSCAVSQGGYVVTPLAEADRGTLRIWLSTEMKSDEGRKRRSKEMNDRKLIFEVSNIRWVRSEYVFCKGMIGRKARN